MRFDTVTSSPDAPGRRRALRWGAAGFAALAVFALAACGSDSNKAQTSATSTAGGGLEDTPWQLLATSPLGDDLGQVAVTATFEAGTVSGFSGCNTYNGPYTVDGSKLTIGPNIARTSKACEPAQMSVEDAYLERLVKTASYKVLNKNLTLFPASNLDPLVFEAQSGGTAAIVGSWNVTSYYNGSDGVVSVVNGSKVTAEFATDFVSGSGGCNTYRGGVTASGSTIKIGPLASTKMACASEELSTQETQFLAAMEMATSFKVTGDKLDLLRDGGTIAATLQRA